MVKIEVFESGGCCSTGVANPEEKLRLSALRLLGWRTLKIHIPA
ncbi:hypothetical protein MKY64_10085 [Paenibacillus sp. FSL R7-0210]